MTVATGRPVASAIRVLVVGPEVRSGGSSLTGAGAVSTGLQVPELAVTTLGFAPGPKEVISTLRVQVPDLLLDEISS